MEETFSVVKSLHTKFLRILGAVAMVIGMIPGTLSGTTARRRSSFPGTWTPKRAKCWTAPFRRWAAKLS